MGGVTSRARSALRGTTCRAQYNFAHKTTSNTQRDAGCTALCCIPAVVRVARPADAVTEHSVLTTQSCSRAAAAPAGWLFCSLPTRYWCQ